ncbi:class I SAM-dependent methyltransferase [Patescibacteria group bacterium]|nr:class I SAM-dependent methyltransferase [Patescibacteria group bacterium]
MNHAEKIKQDSIKEFGSDVTREKYKKNAKSGFWRSEKILVDKYFKTNTDILDIGCGSGRTTVPLYNQGYKVIGVDITPEMIETAKQVAKKNNLNIDYRMGDATKLEFGDNTFDGIIFANNGWSQIPGKASRQQALNEFYRVLKPGGILILTSHRRYFSFYYLLFWIIKWIKFYILKPLGIKIEELDFGDRFFKRIVNEKKLKQRQYIHIAGSGEVEAQIEASNLKLLESKTLGDVAESDAKIRHGSLEAKYNSYKSSVFFICQK